MKKIVSTLLIFVLLVTGLSAGFSAFGAGVHTTSVVSINAKTTEKKYAWGDEITFDVSVTNNGEETLSDLTVSSKPRRAAHFYAADGKDGAKIASLAPGETKTVQLTYTAKRWSAFKNGSGSVLSTARGLLHNFVSRTGDTQMTAKAKVGWFRYRFKIGVSGEGVLVNVPDAAPDKGDGITLTASVKELLKESGTQQVYFYADCHGEATDVSLVDKSGKTLAVMKDDGYYAESGDDLQGDGVYSCKLDLDKNVDTSYAFRAASGSTASKDLTIRVIKPLTTQELQDIATVDETVAEKVFQTPTFADADKAGRKELAKGVLDDLSGKGLLKSESITYSDTSSAYTFMYSSGILGSVILSDWAENTNGPEDETAPAAAEGTASTNAVTSTSSVGDAIVLWSFNQSWDNDNFRRPFYTSLKSDWDALGLTTTVDWDVTVDDYKHLSGYEVIAFSGHGEYATYRYDGKEQTHSALLLSESVNSDRDKAYSADLRSFRIGHSLVPNGAVYAILPDFFEHYYDAGDLSGAFIYAENCEFRGADQNTNSEMPDALLAASAEAVVGFHNSVDANYARNLMNAYVESLVGGQTAENAFAAARSQVGNDDGQGATPMFSGNKQAVLVHAGIQNGDYEEAATPVKWGATGDARVIAKLGELKPQSGSRMAIITTGIGSGESVYLEGTEGSILQQSFVVDEKNKKLSFRYDVVSEEPTEYIGSKYDDTFVAELIDENGQVVETVAKATINASEWHSISGINFDGGDNTTYHTQWQSVSFDMSAYVGHQMTLRFKAYDKGDSIYDTAVLIDAVATKA